MNRDKYLKHKLLAVALLLLVGCCDTWEDIEIDADVLNADGTVESMRCEVQCE